MAGTGNENPVIEIEMIPNNAAILNPILNDGAILIMITPKLWLARTNKNIATSIGQIPLCNGKCQYP